MYKWRIVLGGVASACFLGTIAAGPAIANAATLSGGSGAPNAVTAQPPAAAAAPPSSTSPAPGQGSVPSCTSPQDMTGVLPAVCAATGALLNGIGDTAANLSQDLLPAVGPAVGGLTDPLNGVSQDVGNLAGVPVFGAMVSDVPALPATRDLLGDLNDMVNGGAHAGS